MELWLEMDMNAYIHIVSFCFKLFHIFPIQSKSQPRTPLLMLVKTD